MLNCFDKHATERRYTHTQYVAILSQNIYTYTDLFFIYLYTKKTDLSCTLINHFLFYTSRTVPHRTVFTLLSFFLMGSDGIFFDSTSPSSTKYDSLRISSLLLEKQARFEFLLELTCSIIEISVSKTH